MNQSEENICVFHLFQAVVLSDDYQKLLAELVALLSNAEGALFPQVFDWGNRVLRYHIYKQSIAIPMTLNGQQFDASVVEKLLGIILARIARFCSQSTWFENLNSSKLIQRQTFAKYILLRYIKALSKIDKMKNEKDNYCQNYLSMVFNASRALLDTFKAAQKSVDFLKNIIRPKTLTQEQTQLFNEVKTFILEIIPREGVKSALQQVVNSSQGYQQINATIMDLQAQMIILVTNHIEWVTGNRFLGMVTTGSILLDVQIFVKHKPYTRSRLLVLLFHELFHMVFRVLSKDFSWQTPRSELDNIQQHLEGGYLFEKLIFGTIDSEIWRLSEECFFSMNRWNSIPILTKVEIESAKVPRGIVNPCHSGICFSDQEIKEM